MKEDETFDEDGNPRKKKRVRLYDEEIPLELRPTSRNRNPANQHDIDEVSDHFEGLSKSEERFVWSYTTNYNPIEAAIASGGCHPSRVSTHSKQLLARPNVVKAIKQIEAERYRRMQFDGDEFIARDLAAAQVDLTQLAKLHVPPCRHCWGINHLYQRTHHEFEEAFEEYNSGKGNTKEIQGRLGLPRIVTVPFDQKGGSGYNIWSDPNPACPNCFGRGAFDETGNKPVLLHRSFEHLPPELRMAVNGVKVTKDGTQIIFRDRDSALNRLHGLMKASLEFGINPTSGDRHIVTLKAQNVGLGANRQITRVTRRIVDPVGEGPADESGRES